MKQIVKIEVPYSAIGTKVLNEQGEPLHPRIYSVHFEHKVDDIPRLTLQVFAMETVIEGEMEVEQVAVCPACKKELSATPKHKAALVDVTAHGDEYVQLQHCAK